MPPSNYLQLVFSPHAKYRLEIIHVKERKSIFPFPESCPIFLESERKAEFFGKGGKELERKGIKEKIFSSFPFLF